MFFLLQSISFSFSFSFSCTYLMGKLKMTEHNPISKVFTEIFLIARIPHHTVLINFPQRERQSCDHRGR